MPPVASPDLIDREFKRRVPGNGALKGDWPLTPTDGVSLTTPQEQARIRAAQVLAAIELGRRERALRQLTEVYLFTDQRLRQESLQELRQVSLRRLQPACAWRAARSRPGGR